MTVQLNDDVLRLIADHLRHDWPARSSERPFRADLLAFALVSKSWASVGLDELWREIAIEAQGTGKVVSAVERHPERASGVRALRVSSNMKDGVDRLQAMVDSLVLHGLFLRFSGLNTIELVGGADWDPWTLLSDSAAPSVPSLRQVSVSTTVVWSDDALEHLVRFLAAAEALETVYIGAPGRQLYVPVVRPWKRYSVKHLTLRLTTEGAPMYAPSPTIPSLPSVDYLFSSACDTSRLISLDALVDLSSDAFYRCLSNAANLTRLSLSAIQPVLSSSAVCSFTALLPSFASLHTLSLKTQMGAHPVYSGVELPSPAQQPAFLASIPLSLVHFDVDLCFLGGAESSVLGPFLDERRRRGLVTVKVWKGKDGEETGEPMVLRKIGAEEGTGELPWWMEFPLR
ncbi:hypothetical protein JCM8547_008272 [Rhodosporidiobolus lusitaniae]